MFQCHRSVFSDSPPLQQRGMKEHCEKLGFVFVGKLINKVNYICRYMGYFLYKFKASAGFSFKTPILRVFNRQPHRRCCVVLQDTVKGFFPPTLISTHEKKQQCSEECLWINTVRHPDRYSVTIAASAARGGNNTAIAI